MYFDQNGNLILVSTYSPERGYEGDRKRARILKHAIDPNDMSTRDTGNAATWRRRRVAKAMVDAGFDITESGLSDADRKPLIIRVGDFLDRENFEVGALLVRADELDDLQVRLASNLDFDSGKSEWYAGHNTEEAQGLSQEITDLQGQPIGTEV